MVVSKRWRLVAGDACGDRGRLRSCCRGGGGGDRDGDVDGYAA